MTAQELKNSILQLAVQGKLVPQCKDDEPASELLKRIRAVKEKAVKKEKPLPAILEEEIPFDIPENWEWARLNDISSITSGGTPARTNSSFWNGNIPWVKIGDIRNKYISTTEEKISEQGLNSSSAKIFPKGTILYTIFATIGTVGILNIDAATNQAVAGVTFFGEYSRDYMYYVLIGLKDILVSKGKGMAQMNINLTILKNTPIPIPPLAEQKRIVEKIEELMPLIEEYGKAEEQLSKLDAEFPDKLRKSILQQAVQGKLTERNTADEPASVLLKRIKAEKEVLIKSGKIKKEKPLPEITEDEIPFDIPESWVWVRLGTLCNIINGFTPSRNNSDFWNGNIPWFTIDDVREQGRFIKYTKQHITNKALSKDTQRIVPPNSVLLCCTASVGEYAYTKIALTTNQQFNALVIRDENTNLVWTMYLYVFVQTLKHRIIVKSGKTTFNFLSVGKLQKFTIPIPPLAEQKRIVKRVEELLALCDELK